MATTYTPQQMLDMLNDPITGPKIDALAKKGLWSEAPNFLKEYGMLDGMIKQYEESSPKEANLLVEINQKWNDIADQYIKPGSPFEINITSDQRKNALKISKIDDSNLGDVKTISYNCAKANVDLINQYDLISKDKLDSIPNKPVKEEQAKQVPKKSSFNFNKFKNLDEKFRVGAFNLFQKSKTKLLHVKKEVEESVNNRFRKR